MMKFAQFRVSLDSGGNGIVSMSCPRCGELAVQAFDSMTTETKVLCRYGSTFGIGNAGYQTAKRNIERFHKVIEGIANGPKPK
jgi:hypothetical protein